MKFGLRLPSFALGPKTATLAEMGAYLRHAEDLGFESAVCIDHLLVVPPTTVRTWLEPMVLLSALAGVTRTIKLGPMVIALPLRNPVLMAKEWGTFDVLAGGRSIFGVGVGWHEQEFAAMNIPRNERGRRMDEMLEILIGLWTGDRVSFQGRHYRFEDVTIEPKPLKLPEIWIGGGTQPFEKVYAQAMPDMTPVLRRIAKYAQTWVPHSASTPEMVAQDWERIQGLMVKEGRRPSELTKAYSNFVYVLKKGEKPEAAIPHFSTISGLDLDFWRTYYLVGEAEEVAEQISKKVHALGESVEHIILNPVNWQLDQLEMIARDVLPKVRKS